MKQQLVTILSIEIPEYNSHARPFHVKFLRQAELVVFLSSLPLLTSIHRFDGVLNNDPDATLNTNGVSVVAIRQIKSFQWQTEMCCISRRRSGESQAIFSYKWARNLHALRAIPCTRHWRASRWIERSCIRTAFSRQHPLCPLQASSFWTFPTYVPPIVNSPGSGNLQDDIYISHHIISTRMQGCVATLWRAWGSFHKYAN